MLSIRRTIFNSMSNDKANVKAYALALFIKRAYKSSTIHNFTLNKLHKQTGLHYTSLKKRIHTLKSLGFIDFVGKNKQHLVVKSMVSHHAKRNVDLSSIDFSNVKEIEKSLLVMIIVEVQRQKDYAKDIIRSAYNPKNYKEMKWARKKCKLYGFGHEFKEFGISYKTIAKKLNVSIQKAVKIVKYAVNNGFLEYTRIQKQIFCRGAKFMDKLHDKGYATFVTKNNIYMIYANQYRIGSRVLCTGNY